MYEVKVIPEKNRIYITLGQMGSGEGEPFFNEVKNSVEKLKKGFTAVSDIRKFVITDSEEGMIWAQKVLSLLSESGMALAVRVTGMRTNLNRKKEEAGHEVVITETPEEAEAYLDKESC